jgi:hypothetical protein
MDDINENGNGRLGSGEQEGQTLKDILPRRYINKLNKRDGAAVLRKILPKEIDPLSVIKSSNERMIWENICGYYRNNRRYFEALTLYEALYDHMLKAQDILGSRVHKGMPLVWMRDCYVGLGFPVLAKRYLMLTLIEDAISGEGKIDPDITGTYFRIVWQHGLPDSELKQYSRKAYRLWKTNPQEAIYPEWVLQELNQNWNTELPSPIEALVYRVNTRYVEDLYSRLGEGTGKVLERLADYLLSCMPGCWTSRRALSGSTEYDIVCSMEGFEVDFRSELGRYFICECKDWETPAGITEFAKFCRVLDSMKSRFGIYFAREGISGQRDTRYAKLEQIKVFQDRGMVIVVIDSNDIERIIRGANFIHILRSKYASVRLDLRKVMV